ncbi:MAG: RNA methyltransferase, partial [Ruminococcus sp.]|nr:RNA methyltransferase [Ruminococcus sp.]
AVIGNEGNGLKQETVSACQHKITIPMNGNAESLNASAAATVIIWEMLR